MQANLQVPGGIAINLHPDYRGPDSTPDVTSFVIHAARAMVIGAIESGLAPARPPAAADPGIQRTVSLPDAVAHVIDDLAFAEGLTHSEALRRYLYAAHARGDWLSHRYSPEDLLAQDPLRP